MRRRGGRKIKAGGFIPQDFTSEWKLEESTGSTFFDSKGTNNGTDTDIPSLSVAGKVGNGFNWLSTYTSSIVPHSADFILNDGTQNLPFSFCFWVYRTGGGSLIRFVELGNILFLGIVQNLLRLEYRDNSNVQFAKVASFEGVSVDVWTHLAFTFQPIDATNNTVKLFKNGIEITTTGNPSAQIRNNITPNLAIGGNSFSGPMDEIKYYKQVLTPADVLNIYNAEK